MTITEAMLAKSSTSTTLNLRRRSLLFPLLIVLLISPFANALVTTCSFEASITDISRALTRRPMNKALVGSNLVEISMKLNEALGRIPGLKVRNCSDFGRDELNQVLRMLYGLRSGELERIYLAKFDTRSHGIADADELVASWDWEQDVGVGNERLARILLDAKCHQAVMWYVHHLSEGAKEELKHAVQLPLLPPRQHDRWTGEPLADRVFEYYGQVTTCAVCHGNTNDPKPANPAPKGAPSWPPLLMPAYPTQFTASLGGWVRDVHSPRGMNISGHWYYDFPANRLRIDFTGRGSSFPHLKVNTTMFWFGDPRPRNDTTPGTGWEGGSFYVKVGIPFVPCLQIKYPRLSIVRPDAFSEHSIGKATYVGREYLEWADKWTDHWYTFLNHTTDHSCDGPFNLWVDIETSRPVQDYGVKDCNTPRSKQGVASSHWQSYSIGPPPAWLWEQDFSKCKETKESSTVFTPLSSDDALRTQMLSIARSLLSLAPVP